VSEQRRGTQDAPWWPEVSGPSAAWEGRNSATYLWLFNFYKPQFSHLEDGDSRTVVCIAFCLVSVRI
jgi:hypothetical protein